LARTGDHWDGEQYVDSGGQPATRPFVPNAISDPYLAVERELERQRAITRNAPRFDEPSKPRASAPFRSRSLRRIFA
jgi:hypothetical protein